MQQQLTPQQYQQVLKYMQSVSEQDFQLAILVLRQHNFNLTAAINTKFGQNDRIEPNNNYQHNRIQHHENQQDDQQVIRKYIHFLNQQNQKEGFVSNVWNFVKGFTVGIFKLVSQILIPQVLLKKFLRSKFYVMYKDYVKINFHDDKFTRLLLNTKDTTYKSCFLVISASNQRSQQIITLLNKDDIVKKINQSFYFIGFTQNDNQLQLIQNQRPPEIIICRYNIYKQLIILKRFTGTQQISSMTLTQLNTLTQQSRNHFKRDKNILIKYRNFLHRSIYGPLYIQQQQQQQINPIIYHNTTHEIRQQNQQYKQIQQQELKRLQKQKQIHEIKMKQKQQQEIIQQLRKIRKMSIPDEPTSGEIIRFIFRCPDGSNKMRNFQNDEKVELIYNWVETNQQIEFEDNQKRSFEILYGYPLVPLTDKKDNLLKDVFDGDQEKLFIKEI